MTVFRCGPLRYYIDLPTGQTNNVAKYEYRFMSNADRQMNS